MLVRKQVHVPIEEQTWDNFKILAIKRGKSVAGMISELVYREVAEAAFEVGEDKE